MIIYSATNIYIRKILCNSNFFFKISREVKLLISDPIFKGKSCFLKILFCIAYSKIIKISMIF